MSDDRMTLVPLGTAVRRLAVQAADTARAAGSCPHAGALFVSAADPSAGIWCVSCGHRPLGDVLLTPWCVFPECSELARPGVVAARADGRLEVLVRACLDCLTRDADEHQEDDER